MVETRLTTLLELNTYIGQEQLKSERYINRALYAYRDYLNRGEEGRRLWTGMLTDAVVDNIEAMGQLGVSVSNNVQDEVFKAVLGASRIMCKGARALHKMRIQIVKKKVSEERGRQQTQLADDRRVAREQARLRVRPAHELAELAAKRAKAYKVKKRKALRAERNENRKRQVNIPEFYQPGSGDGSDMAAARDARLKAKWDARDKKRADGIAEKKRLALERQLTESLIKVGGKQPVRRRCQVTKGKLGSTNKKKKTSGETNNSSSSNNNEETSLVKDTGSGSVMCDVYLNDKTISDSEPNNPIVSSVEESQRTPPQVKRRRIVIQTTPDSQPPASPLRAGTPASDSCSLVRGRLP
jgi:hypothetical protein